jgi:DtxR family Mn-dependent transcriptional regulator
VIREVQDDHPERLRRWQTLGLIPGTKVRILSYQPLDDMYQLQVGDVTIPVGSEGLAGLRGEIVDVD